jgi:predicted alpha/beta-hydrolase family hydrolase
VTEQTPDPPGERFHRERREHGGAPAHLDDDQLARLAEEERVEAGIEAYDPDEVPAATDAPPGQDATETKEYLEERAEIRRELDKGELRAGGEPDPFPPTHYDRS